MKKSLVIPVVILTLAIIGIVFFTFNKTKNTPSVNPGMRANNETLEEKTEVIAENNMVKAGSYIDYSPAALAKATQNNGKAVLFFHAPWCPFCKAADKDINSRLTEIPANLTILKTDYDSETKLKDRYGVTYQHTFVQVDKDGNEIAKWQGGELDEIIARAK